MDRVADPTRMSGFSAPHCGSLRATDEGREVELYGWVARRRDHGGVAFIDLRDRWGTVQVVIRSAETLPTQLRHEYVVRVAGKVARRPGGSENPKMATGEIEVVAEDLDVLSVAKTPPFPIEDELEADESVRLKYRYLDLRRPRMQQILELRHRVNKIIHSYMDEREFVEVETPLLIKTTPEGARDFIVPSRLYPGEFYALPQSPQTLKQLLMVAGLGRYYQIARCLRDEDLRADRQLEFTQLDVEMSFCDEEDVFSLVEGLFSRIWKEILGIDLQVPFPRIDQQEAFLRYGTDQPDLRYDLEIADLGGALAETKAEVFASVLRDGGVVRGMAVPGGSDMNRKELDELTTLAKGAGGKGLAWLPGPLDKFLSDAERSAIRQTTRATEGDVVLLVAAKADSGFYGSFRCTCSLKATTASSHTATIPSRDPSKTTLHSSTSGRTTCGPMPTIPCATGTSLPAGVCGSTTRRSSVAFSNCSASTTRQSSNALASCSRRSNMACRRTEGSLPASTASSCCSPAPTTSGM